MSNKGINASLAVQMDRLKKSMSSRDKRRDQDKQRRVTSAAESDPYARTHVVPATGGVSLGPGAAAQAAVANAAALAGPTLLRCELCQATFKSEAMLRQHKDGPSHKKALAKKKAEDERLAWMGNSDAAKNALAAAAWLNGDGGGARRQQSGSVGGRGSGGRGGGPGGRVPFRHLPDSSEATRPQGLSHQDIVAQALKKDQPISIGGWYPPSLELSPQPPAAHSSEDEDDEDRRAQSPAEAALDDAQELARAPVGASQEPLTEEDAGGLSGLLGYGGSDESDSDSSEDSDKEGPDKPKITSFF